MGRLSRGGVRAACAVLGDHRLVVRLRVGSGTFLVAEGTADALQAFRLPLPGVVVGWVAHVVVDEGVFGLLVLVVAVCQLQTKEESFISSAASSVYHTDGFVHTAHTSHDTMTRPHRFSFRHQLLLFSLLFFSLIPKTTEQNNATFYSYLQ